MIKKIFIAVICCFNVSVFACDNALPTDNPNFCASFKSVATCYCSSSLPSGMCQDMNTLYNRMVTMFGSLQNACNWQHHTSTQDCIDNWNCYRNGGRDSQNRLCSGTGVAC